MSSLHDNIFKDILYFPCLAPVNWDYTEIQKLVCSCPKIHWYVQSDMTIYRLSNRHDCLKRNHSLLALRSVGAFQWRHDLQGHVQYEEGYKRKRHHQGIIPVTSCEMYPQFALVKGKNTSVDLLWKSFCFFKLQIWDIGGQPRFRSMWEHCCRGVNAIVWVFWFQWNQLSMKCIPFNANACMLLLIAIAHFRYMVDAVSQEKVENWASYLTRKTTVARNSRKCWSKTVFSVCF